jgi:type 2 lantibiotic biosynthesis protein LanM
VLLKNTVNPKLVQNGADRSIELDILSRAFLSYDVKPYTWSLLDWEHQALDRLDIPHFITYSDSKDLIVNPNEIIKSFFKASGYDLMMSRLQYLNDEDLEQQIAIIRASLPSLVIVGKPINLSLSKSVNLDFDSVAILTTEAMVQKAIEIGVKIRQHATIIDGSASWIGLEYLPETGRFHLQPLAFGLEGFFGVALFLAALEKVTGEREFHDLALKALQPLHKILKNSRVCQHLIKLIGIGGKDGSGSIVYSLVQIAQLLGEPNLLEDAQQVASLITPDHIARDRDLDIVLGSAGAILGFLALYKVTANTDVLEKAIICGQHLLEHRVVSDTGYKAWMPIGNEKPLTGFSHGAAGIAYALLRLYETTLEPIFLDAATEAISYERSVFSSEAQNWPDFRPPATNNKQPSFTTSWCTGAPGIGLARLGSLAILDSPEIRQEIDVAVQTTQNFSQQGVDNVCCGNFGRIDVLIEAACRLSQPELLEIAHRKTSWLVTRAEQTGFFNLFPNLPQGIYHPNLFSGMAGIGYTLLKLAKPDLLPSVLLLE